MEMRLPSLNLVILSGRLTQEPELRYTPSGRAVTRLRLAVPRRFKGQDGEWREDTLFIDVTAWGPLAERSAERLGRGSPVLVEGRLRSRSWESETGQKRTTIEVIAQRIQFLEKTPVEEISTPGPDGEEPGVGEVVPEEGSPEDEELPF